MYIEEIIDIFKNVLKQYNIVKEIPSSNELIGAATFHELFLINPESLISTYWIQSCVRHSDAIDSFNTYRSAQHTQFQIIVPTYCNPWILIKRLFRNIGAIDVKYIRFVPDNWKNPTIGSFGMGWEVHYLGVEIGQITYFNKVLNKDVSNVLEVVFGLERLALIINKSNQYYLTWKSKSKNLYNYFINRRMLTLPLRPFNQVLKVFHMVRKRQFSIHNLYQLSIMYNHIDTNYHISILMKTELISLISSYIPR